MKSRFTNKKLFGAIEQRPESVYSGAYRRSSKPLANARRDYAYVALTCEELPVHAAGRWAAFSVEAIERAEWRAQTC